MRSPFSAVACPFRSPLPALSAFQASDARLLRASLSAFMDMLALATRTLEAFQ